MTLEAWGDRLAPDIPVTLRRFPLPVALAAAATLCILLLTNELVPNGDETFMRAAAGLASAAVFAVAGVFFAESRNQDRVASAVLAYAVPLLVVGLFQVRDTTWFVPHGLPFIGVLWLSVAAFTRGWGRAGGEDRQNRFWWLNHRAVASGAIAGLALGVIAVGIVAIERTVSTLFGFEVTAFYRTVLPLLGFFFAPLYWLSTLPRLADYDPRVLEQPDFLARAVGLLGKFVLIPLLLAYALILLAYVAQIAVTQSLPQGVLGWMVTGFVMAGAGTWLVLHPPFVRGSGIVRFFRATWFWLTLLPLALFAVALYVRVDAYGLTPERLLLFWGGVWGAVLAAVFLLRRGDIRLIPGLAAIALLAATFGPWNVDNLPRVQQALVLDALLTRTEANGASAGVPPDWSAVEKERGVGAIYYLSGSQNGQRELARVLAGHGFEVGETANAFLALRALSVEPGRVGSTQQPQFSLKRDLTQPVDVATTPWLLRHVNIGDGRRGFAKDALSFRIVQHTLEIGRDGILVATADLRQLVGPDNGTELARSTVEFSIGDRRYRIVPDYVTVQLPDNVGGTDLSVTYLQGTLFSSGPSD